MDLKSLIVLSEKMKIQKDKLEKKYFEKDAKYYALNMLLEGIASGYINYDQLLYDIERQTKIINLNEESNFIKVELAQKRKKNLLEEKENGLITVDIEKILFLKNINFEYRNMELRKEYLKRLCDSLSISCDIFEEKKFTTGSATGLTVLYITLKIPTKMFEDEELKLEEHIKRLFIIK